MRLQKQDLIKYATHLKTDYTSGKYSIKVEQTTFWDYKLELRNNEKQTFEIIFVWKTREAYEFLRGFYRAYNFLSTAYIEKEYILEKLEQLQNFVKNYL